jgi:uncharacterized membrane protein required for colicin V production
MGLDIALGILILIAAIRGWIQGFVHQAIRIAGLIACIYLADRVRDQAKPFVLPYLPTIQPDLVDRLLWWVSAAVGYALLVGVGSLVIRMTRRPDIPGLPPSGRNDQFAGFLLGAAKGALIAAFLAAGIEKYALKQITTIAWAEEQAKSSLALRWNQEYQPAAKVWSSTPVRNLVGHIQRMGLQNPSEPRTEPVAGLSDQRLAQTGQRQAERDGAGSPDPTNVTPSSPRPSVSRTLPGSVVPDADLEKAFQDLKGSDGAVRRPD